jgi:hypothetical protein
LTITKSSATAIEIPSGATYPVNAYGATTGSTQIAIANTGGTSYFGNESSGAGTTFSGTAAYATLLGTSAARSLQFVTNNTVRATLDSSGNLGIGTTSPTTAGGRAIHIANSSGDSRLHLTDNTTGATADDGTEIVVNGGNLYIDQKESQPIIILTGSTERMRINSSGNVGIGTSSPAVKLDITNNSATAYDPATAAFNTILSLNNTTSGASNNALMSFITESNGEWYIGGVQNAGNTAADFIFASRASGARAERARILSNGNMVVGKTTSNYSAAGTELYANGEVNFVKSSGSVVYVNRLTNDGILVELAQDGVTEGNISVSGSTVSYNGGHLSRWAQITTAKDESLVKGTVLSNLDAMNVYTDADGNPVENEQLNKVKVSDTEGDANVAGVFVNWDHDKAHNVDEINMAMTGDMIIRIAQGTTVARGDLLMSAGDGTAKPQGDDIVRSKTVAKVTSTHVTCTYADGSFCVPCVLMAC